MFGCTVQDGEKIIRSYEKAHNSHDVEKVLSFYSDDIEFELKGVWVKSGINEVRAITEWDAALNSNLKFESIIREEDSVFCRVIENNDWFGAVNIVNLVHDPVVFIIQDGKIKKIIATPSEKTGMEIQAVIGSVYQWSDMVKDNTIHDLIQNGEFVYSREAAGKWLDLFKRWKTFTQEIK
jgi:hypothetical protein